MLQLALRQQQLHAAHMQIKLQHQTNEHNNVQQAQHHHKQQQQQQQRTTSFGIDQLGSSAVARGAGSLDVTACLQSATSAASWRTQRERHEAISTTPLTALTTADQRHSQTITQVYTGHSSHVSEIAEL